MNPVLLRKQLQENAADLKDYFNELKNWGEEMKRKEEALKSGDQNETSPQSKSEHKKVKKSVRGSTKSQKQIISKKPATKLGVTDYAAWDKFDADAECDKLEDDISEDSELTDENDNSQDLALIEKEKGNKFVKNQEWDEAIKCYTKAIQCYPYDPIFYANRALCSLKKNRFEDAENDCSLSLKLDNTYVKAYQRRAAAREGLNKLEHAEFDLLKVLELEPKNKESKEALDRIQKRLGHTEKATDQRPVSKFTASRNKSNIRTPAVPSSTLTSNFNEQNVEIKKVLDTSEPVPTWKEEDDIILVKAINKPPHMQSKKPLKRIKIVEKNTSVVENKEVVGRIEPEAIKQHVFEKQEKVEPPKHISVFKKERGEIFKEKRVENLDNSTAFPKTNEKSFTINSDDFKVVEKEPPDLKEVKNTSNKSLSNETNKITDEKTNTEFVKPKNSVQFNLIWKNLQSSEDKYEFLKRVDPQDLPKIFLNSLESGLFSGILEVLAKHFIENNDPVFDILNYFTQVKRFGAITMFMSPSDKKNLWKLFDYVKENEQKNKEEVDRLIDKYEL